MTAKRKHIKKKPTKHKAIIKERTWKDNIFFYTVAAFVLVFLGLMVFH